MESLEIAKELCTYLDGYHPRADLGVNVVLEHESGDGRSLFICIQDDKKWEASVTWPRRKGSWYRPETPVKCIGVSKRRGIEALATDITKRLLPAYHAEYPEQLALMERHTDRENSQLALRDELLEMIDPGRPSTDRDSLQVPVYNCGIRRVNVSGDTVELNTNYLPKETAIKIIELLIAEGFRKDKD